MKKSTKINERTKKIVCISMFCAAAYIISFCFPIKVQFLTFDAKDSIIAIGGMFFGPLAALTMSVIVPILEFLSFSDTGLYGLIMNFLSSAAFSVTASLVYKYRRRMSGATLGIILAVVTMTSVMMVANLVITPFYVSMPRETVAKMIPTLLLPFNLTKSLLNSALVLLLYKPLTRAIRDARLAPAKTAPKASPKTTVITVACAILLLLACIYVYIFVLKGTIGFFGK